MLSTFNICKNQHHDIVFVSLMMFSRFVVIFVFHTLFFRVNLGTQRGYTWFVGLSLGVKSVTVIKPVCIINCILVCCVDPFSVDRHKILVIRASIVLAPFYCIYLILHSFLYLNILIGFIKPISWLNCIFIYLFSSNDMWGLGCLVWESYNGPLRNRASLKDINNVSIMLTIWKIHSNITTYILFSDSEIRYSTLLRTGRCQSDESSKSSRYYYAMSQTGGFLQKRSGRYVAVFGGDPNQGQGWEIAFLQCDDRSAR